MIEIDSINKVFGEGGNEVSALDDVSLHIGKNEFVTLIGPSGCGKTTLLRIVAGLTPATSGRCTVGGAQVRGPGADRAMVFQSFALLPWATVKDNIAFGLLLQGESKRIQEHASMRLAELVGLKGFENARPSELSGGMQQRVGLARALAVKPKVLLMDEPFGSLDEQTKRVMQTVLLDVWEEEKVTVLFVTHSIDEAVFLGDRVVMMRPRPGRIDRIVDVPFERPRTRETEKSQDFASLRVELWDELLLSGAREGAGGRTAKVDAKEGSR